METSSPPPQSEAADASGSASTPAVEIRGLTKKYRLPWKNRVLIAVNALDLTVERGEVFGLLGPNGSGKSTTMKMLLGLVRPTSGTARIFGLEAESMAARARMGLLPENPYFYKFLNGDETLRYFGKLCGLRGAALEKRVNELIKLVNLENGRDRPLGAYSKGMLQRIGLAQAMVHDPELLLLDEPTAGVDPIGSREIRDLIVRLREMGKTVIFCSHLLEQVQEVSDRVAIMSLGNKMVEGSLDELLVQQDTAQLAFDGLPPEKREEARAALERLGATNVRLERPRLSLEQLFLKAVEHERERPDGQRPTNEAKE
ncbi:MAG: ABC transporter ATP-binding protein [Verrucomicrobiota bacterium]